MSHNLQIGDKVFHIKRKQFGTIMSEPTTSIFQNGGSECHIQTEIGKPHMWFTNYCVKVSNFDDKTRLAMHLKYHDVVERS